MDVDVEESILLGMEINKLNYYGQKGEIPSKERQKYIIKEILEDEKGKEEGIGDSRFLISISWWGKWCSHVKFENFHLDAHPQRRIFSSPG